MAHPTDASEQRTTSSRTLTTTLVAADAAVAVTASGAKKRKRRTPELTDESMAWTPVPVEGEPPAERYDCGVAVFERMLLVVGGIVGNQRLNDLYVLELPAEAESGAMPPVWRKPQCSGPPPPAGFLLQPFVLGETLYVIGGTTDGKFLNELHAMNLRTFVGWRSAGEADKTHV